MWGVFVYITHKVSKLFHNFALQKQRLKLWDYLIFLTERKRKKFSMLD